MTTTFPEPRVIGRRRGPTKRVSFTLVCYDNRDAEKTYTLTARAQLDTSSVFGFGADDVSPGRRIRSIEKFLTRVLVDDDGMSARLTPRQYIAPSEPEDGDGGKSSAELVPVSDDDIGVVDTVWRLAAWNDDDQDWQHHDTEFPSASLARQAADRDPSSLRRFAMIMDDDFLVVEQSALEEIVDFLVTAAADRPTEPSGASPRSTRRKRA